ncbi:hypothetical protein PPERSA_00196 [Pseudocohnilembus persalinus]|uniref:Uncharacterized protein n=1 Tax=Pseudocohnilembus persalinus TaxID=266149 RepID=A0A0V0QQA2_PSEPJ|nr:hypothetical protein PPERSA_00196 [Pseudocohnilembus persalinus]|eukprot:KRX04427.1 hypothetical protein PPERSA_00196 [Pseudocohnilembus persalinus]
MLIGILNNYLYILALEKQNENEKYEINLLNKIYLKNENLKGQQLNIQAIEIGFLETKDCMYQIYNVDKYYPIAVCLCHDIIASLNYNGLLKIWAFDNDKLTVEREGIYLVLDQIQFQIEEQEDVIFLQYLNFQVKYNNSKQKENKQQQFQMQQNSQSENQQQLITQQQQELNIGENQEQQNKQQVNQEMIQEEKEESKFVQLLILCLKNKLYMINFMQYEQEKFEVYQLNFENDILFGILSENNDGIFMGFTQKNKFEINLINELQKQQKL